MAARHVGEDPRTCRTRLFRPAGPAARVELMRHAAALLNPITWPKPFGLVMAEALATAMPVLAFPNGAEPEIIDHSRAGYLCCGEDEMTAAVARVGEIDLRQCRAAERRFSLARMAADYERLYRVILEHPGRSTPERTGIRAL
jgi:glycosyltransferase involved in cell wall biosynthesis